MVESITEKITDLIVKTDFSDIPEKVVETFKYHALDTIGVLVAGCTEKIFEIIEKYIKALGCTEICTVIPRGLKTSPQYAAFGNAVLGHVLDFDDSEPGSRSLAHPSAVVLAATLALGEKLKATGKECLESFIIGIEVMSSIGSGINPNHSEQGWHPTSTLGTLGSASASAKMLKLDSERASMALGIAASMSSGLKGNFGTMTKAFHAGHASKSGVEAAELASLGLTANRAILESELGFCSTFTGNKKHDIKKIVDRLAELFPVYEPGSGIKAYPCARASHAVLDGVFYLINKFQIKSEEVDSVECGINHFCSMILTHPDPQTGLEAKFSLEFCVAVALRDREVNLEKFTDAKVRDPEIKALLKKVKKFVTKDVASKETKHLGGATVRINLKNGQSFFYKVEAAKGTSLNPLSRDEIVQKFIINAKMVYSANQIDKILDKFMHLDALNDVNELISSLILQKQA